jgi:preprotein translocase subunit YajC
LTQFEILAQTTPVAAPPPPPAPSNTAQPTAVTGQPSAPAPASQPKDPPPFLSNQMIPLILGIAVLYFFVFRNKRTTDKKRTSMLSQLKRGDRVQTIGGILGTVIEARESDVLVKVDESSNTKIRFTRNAIHRVVEEEKPAEAK